MQVHTRQLAVGRRAQASPDSGNQQVLFKQAGLIDPSDNLRYEDLAKTASVFSSPPWIRAICSAYQFEPRASLVTSDCGAPIAALPYVEVADLRGPRAVGFPFSDFCPPPGANKRTWPLLLQPLLATRRPIVLRLFDDPSLAGLSSFQRTGRALWHGTEVTPTEDTRWACLKGSARGNIRKARASGVTVVRRTDRAALECFHAMHRQVRRRKYRMLAQAPSFFAALADEFLSCGKLTVLLAYYEGKPIAGGVMLEWHDTLYYKLNASTLPAMRPNDLLAWEGMNLAHEKGLSWFDFGLSNADQQGLIRFKRKFATAEKDIVTLRHEPIGHRPIVPDGATRSISELTALLVDERIPDDILDAASELLYRNFA